MAETKKKAKRFIIKVLGRHTRAIHEHITIVDADDAHLLRAYVWTVQNSPREVNGKKVDAKYVMRRLGDGVVEYLHQRVIGAAAGEMVWHINGDSLDNRKANLLRDTARVQELDD